MNSIYYYGLRYRSLFLAGACALATGYAAQIRLPVPGSPVPITMQTLVVLLTALLLGRSWGVVSQTMYVVLGVVGFPFFSGFSGGIGVILGPRGGYLLGFIIAAFFVGWLFEKPIFKRFVPLFLMLVVVSLTCILGVGCLWLGCWCKMVQRSFPDNLLVMGFYPFIVGDVLKAFVASIIAVGLTLPQPKQRNF